jgi:PBP1b-binding outer membrane lipoprotein LpoB
MKRLFAIFTCAVFLTACNDETTTTDSTTDTTAEENKRGTI